MEGTDQITRVWRLALLAPAVLGIGLLLAGPLGLLLSFSVAPGGSTRADFSDGPTLENYVDLLADGFYLGIIARTVWMSLLTTAWAVVLGWPLAYFLWHAPPRLKSLLTLAVVAPLLISIPVRNYGWMVILGDRGVINTALAALGLTTTPLRLMFTDAAVIVGLTHVLMPFVVLSVLAALERVPANLVEAAETLGAGRLRAIFAVAVPLSMPGILAGAVLVFCVAMSSYVTPALMGPSGAKYAATLLYQQFVSMFNWPRGAALATILLVFTIAAIALVFGAIGRRYRHILRRTA
jgi:putative spermidine/putrescine transport system permease protein